MSSPLEDSLRQRIIQSQGDTVIAQEPASSYDQPDDAKSAAARDQIVWGKTPSGQVFRVPTTHDVITALFHPSYPKSHIDIVNLALLALQLLLFYALPSTSRKVFFFLYFAFWRAAYDAGLGYVLTKQSKRRWIVRSVHRLGWLDEKRRPEVRAWIRRQLVGKMGKDYSFDELPLEYNTWLLFRQAVDIILINDFLSFCLFAFACFRVPSGLSMFIHVLRWLGGIVLIAFNLWVKSEAHHVVKDYGWYWGDCFFQRGALVFDGVFELAPHPMYSVGYAWIYGISLIVGSYPVLFVSLAAHAAQFAFLVFFENPHIERFYGQRKPLAQRVPIRRASPPVSGSANALSLAPSSSQAQGQALLRARAFSDPPSTPSVTEGSTASDSETETELELQQQGGARTTKPTNVIPPADTPPIALEKKRSHSPLSHHDLRNRYFRRDTIFLVHLDVFRAQDFMLLLAMAYPFLIVVLPNLMLSSPELHFGHALAWTLFHTFGLGLVLQAQSARKFLVRHFLKHYHYPARDGSRGAVREAFASWKAVYNLSMCMSYVSCFGLVWKTYDPPLAWITGHGLLRHTVGAILIAFHIWVTTESYEVLGVFGWFYGDFFMDDYPFSLDYSGIYRYLNNPEIVAGAAFFGMALISGSKFVYILAGVRHISYWWFLRCVEHPHMRKLYGDSLRKDAGFTKVVKKVASHNARLLESRAGRHAPEIRRVVQEMRGTLDRVYEDAAEVVEEFLAMSRPKLSEVVQDTKFLLQQSREKLVIPLLANDLSAYETDKYKVRVVSRRADCDGGVLRFHLGEQIKIAWKVPRHHSRRDWIGLYRVGANQSSLVTRTSSLGMWMPVHDKEWDGDFPIGEDINSHTSSTSSSSESGTVVFQGDALPWTVGRYEVRYHHDGMYNVLALDGPIEIYVDHLEKVDFESVRAALAHVVPLCLDGDPSLIPSSCPSGGSGGNEEGEGGDPDDFRFWSERQAWRIARAIREMFGVEYAPDVVVADANLSALAQRIITSRQIIMQG
ncbi:phospholipid methyltransferase-domain-containing protein [Multifurca ochricompacta]|uniref:Phosphatidylethanolamine N-methyltransferase n=1 Tax=Multifurca ochricompacta TaxID=376703 RepID=A0AAD4M0G2_9AGAM|nr:phospholipid methyltransferase-domain-containing protein [Multifurca ochricompacta]